MKHGGLKRAVVLGITAAALVALVALLVPGLRPGRVGEQGEGESRDATATGATSGGPTLAGGARAGPTDAVRGSRATFDVRDAVSGEPCLDAEFYTTSTGAPRAAPVDEAAVLAHWQDGDTIRFIRSDVLASEQERAWRERLTAERRPDSIWVLDATGHRSLGVRCPGYAPRLVSVPAAGTMGLVLLRPARVLQGSVSFPAGGPDHYRGLLAAVGTNGEGAWSVAPAAGGEFAVSVGAERVVLACRSEAWVIQEPVRTFAPGIDKASVVLVHNPAVRAELVASGERHLVSRAVLVDSMDRQHAIVLAPASAGGPPRLLSQPGSQRALGGMRAPMLIVFSPAGYTGALSLDAAARVGAVPEIVVPVSVGKGRPGLVLGGTGASTSVLNVVRRPVGYWARSTLEGVRQLPVDESGRFELLLEPGNFLLWADGGPVLPLDHRGAGGGDLEVVYRVTDVGHVLVEPRPPEDRPGRSWGVVARSPFTGEQILKNITPGAVTEFHGLTAGPWHFALDELPANPAVESPSYPVSRVLVGAGTTQTLVVGAAPPTGLARRRFALSPQVLGLADSMRVRLLGVAEQVWLDVPKGGELDVLLQGARELELEGQEGERWRIGLGDGGPTEHGTHELDLGEGTYFGTVRTHRGTPVPRARVALTPLRRTGLGLTVATVLADESGRYQARGLYTGERYRLSFTTEGYARLGEFLPSAPPSAEGVQIDLSEMRPGDAADAVDLEIEFRGQDRHPGSSVRWSILSTVTTNQGSAVVAESEARFLRAGVPVEAVRVVRASGYLASIVFVRDPRTANADVETLWIPLTVTHGRSVIDLP